MVLFLGGGGRSQGLLGVGLRVRWVWLVLGFCRAWSRASGVGEGRSDCVGPRPREKMLSRDHMANRRPRKQGRDSKDPEIMSESV